jgi:hypothetical protein
MSEGKIDYIKEGLEAQYMVREAIIKKIKKQHIHKLFPTKTIVTVRITLTVYSSCKDSHLIELGNLIHHFGWTKNDLN